MKMRTNTILALSAFVSFAPTAAIAAEPDPYARADETWISIGGVVQDVRPHRFTLHYGDGTVTVEMDDADRDADAYKLVAGDKVSVNGKIDDDFYQTTTIEASSVYVDKLGTYFFADPKDEEGSMLAFEEPLIGPSTVVRGKVTKVGAREFTLATGPRELTVDVGRMPYNPLDKEGYQQVEVGDRVRVVGRIDENFFEGRELMANSVITIHAADRSVSR